jgi:RNA polymerase sigma-70 factor, ECF subfamily
MDVRATLIPRKTATRDFESFFRAEYPKLVRTLYLITGSVTEAEDIAQEAMSRAFERWKRVRSMESPGGYVCQTALNLNRKRMRRLAVGAKRVFRAERETDPMRAAEDRSDIARALATLPVGQREALVLTGWLDFSAEDAGKVLRISPPSVRSQASRAREALRVYLEAADE